jgi:hypothetical protein
MYRVNSKKWYYFKKSPFIEKDEFKVLTVGERVKYNNINCWSFLYNISPLYGTIIGMDDGLYIIKLENKKIMKVKRNKIESFPTGYQSF